MIELGDQVGGWDWYATLTFRDITQRGTWTKPGWQYTQGAFDRFLVFLRELRGLGDPSWVSCREYQHWRGVPHFHALINGVADLRRDEAWAWWFPRYGFARILPYNPQLGAGYYLCKYVTKELGDIRFSDTLVLKA